jgi:NAD(P)H dehydrogenase (quinone)
VTSYAAIAAGELDLVSDAVAVVAGHPPIGVAEYLRRDPGSYRHLAERPGTS